MGLGSAAKCALYPAMKPGARNSRLSSPLQDHLVAMERTFPRLLALARVV